MGGVPKYKKLSTTPGNCSKKNAHPMKPAAVGAERANRPRCQARNADSSMDTVQDRPNHDRNLRNCSCVRVARSGRCSLSHKRSGPRPKVRGDSEIRMYGQRQRTQTQLRRSGIALSLSLYCLLLGFWLSNLPRRCSETRVSPGLSGKFRGPTQTPR